MPDEQMQSGGCLLIGLMALVSWLLVLAAASFVWGLL